MSGDPDEEERSKRSARIRSDEHSADTIRSASWAEIEKAMTSLYSQEGESVADMEELACRLETPGTAHGVGKARRRLSLCVEGFRRFFGGR